MNAVEALRRCIVEVGRRVSDFSAREIAAVAMDAGGAQVFASRADSISGLETRKHAKQLAVAWADHAGADAAAVAEAVITAQLAAEAESRAETVELVWTGPATFEVPVARNDEALFEVIHMAERELLVVSYATWQVPRVVAALGSAADVGVEVALVLEFHGSKDDGSDNWDAVAGLGGALDPRIRVLHWPVEQREVDPRTNKMGYVHVKCAVADETVAFVSSANLTVYAMEKNMELGVIVRGGPVPGRIARHFRKLIHDGVLQPWAT